MIGDGRQGSRTTLVSLKDADVLVWKLYLTLSDTVGVMGTRWGGDLYLWFNLLMLGDPTCMLVLPVVFCCSFDSGRNKTMCSYTSL